MRIIKCVSRGQYVEAMKTSRAWSAVQHLLRKEFLLDELVFNSRVYKKAFASCYPRKPYINTMAVEEEYEKTSTETKSAEKHSRVQGDDVLQSALGRINCAQFAEHDYEPSTKFRQ